MFVLAKQFMHPVWQAVQMLLRLIVLTGHAAKQLPLKYRNDAVQVRQAKLVQLEQ